MPIYEYLCPQCNSRFELLRPLSCSDEEASCPKCQGSAQRVPSTFASLSKDSEGITTPIAGSGSSCSSCSAASCSSCH